MRLGIVGLGLVVLIVLVAAGCAQVPTADPGAILIPPSVEPATQDAVPSPGAASDADRPPLPAKSSTAPALADAAPPPPPANLWQHIRGGFRLPNLQGPLVEEWEQWYSSRPDYVGRMVDRSGRFLYHVVAEVERRGMPLEIALLPMIESAYNPQAYSRSHASGMWQFIPTTGRIYGLRQNFWYDGRRDPIAATSAALDYLEKLHGMFGDWALALAAYNWGEGAVSRAIAKNQAKGMPADYENLTMPPETRNYVPKLQAVKNIISNPRAYGLELADIPNQPYFATVRTDRHIDVKLAARLAEMPLEEFRFLNPAHNKPVIKADGDELILLPIDKAEIFRRNLAANDQPLVSWQTYTVKRSDKPEHIAETHGMSLAQLKEVNAIPPPKKIVPGQTLMVPVSGNAAPHLPDLPAPSIVRAPKAGKPRQVAHARAGAVTRTRVTTAGKRAVRASHPPVKRSKITVQAHARKVTLAASEKDTPK